MIVSLSTLIDYVDALFVYYTGVHRRLQHISSSNVLILNDWAKKDRDAEERWQDMTFVLIAAIQKIPDADIRQALLLHHVKGLEWAVIAHEIHFPQISRACKPYYTMEVEI